MMTQTKMRAMNQSGNDDIMRESRPGAVRDPEIADQYGSGGDSREKEGGSFEAEANGMWFGV